MVTSGLLASVLGIVDLNLVASQLAAKKVTHIQKPRSGQDEGISPGTPEFGV